MKLPQHFSFVQPMLLWFFSLAALFTYFLNLGVNDIWIQNESFYAEAAREMLVSGNYLEVFYNYIPRFNKPPLLYWIIAIFMNGFGISEAIVRLPIVFMGLGTVYTVYLLGKLLGGRQLGILAAAIMAFSFQFLINTRYASPEVPLTFFFTLTMYWFLKGYLTRRYIWILLSSVALGLTVLTKGYPYFLVIGGIMGLFTVFESRWNWPKLWARIQFLRPWWVISISGVIGFSWIGYMLMTQSDAFFEVLMNETFRRAFTRPSGLKPFFYLEANLWGFLPYALPFYMALIYWLVKGMKGFQQHLLLPYTWSWIIIMFVVFTIAKGKIPTYFIQAHPAMALFTAFFLLKLPREAPRFARWVNISMVLTLSLITLINIALIWVFQGPWWAYPIVFLPWLSIAVNHQTTIPLWRYGYTPFYGFVVTYGLFAWLALPAIEGSFRPFDQIGQVLNERVPDKQIPLVIEEKLFHNLPFYVERQIVPYQASESIRYYDLQGPLLVLVPKEHQHQYGKNPAVIWEGILYHDSESRTLEFILQQFRYQTGQPSKFSEYVILWEQ